MESAGYESQSFTDPAMALEYFRENSSICPLVVTDIRMPGMNGFELARVIKRIRPDTTIVFMTAFEVNRSEFERVFPSLHVDGFIQKYTTLLKR